MFPRERTKMRRQTERGNTLFILAASLFMLLGMGALAVDLASLYAARNQAQRAADAAALAAAKYLVESGCVTTGSCSTVVALGEPLNRATQSAAQNFINGQPVTVTSVILSSDTPQNPQITVNVQSSNFDLYFAGALGITSAPTLSATATAEAWNPSGGAVTTTYCTSCVRPWLIPNCDQSVTTGVTNPLCNTATPNPEAYLLTPGSYSVAPTFVIGELITIPLGTPTSTTVIPPATLPTTLYGALDVDSSGTASFIDYQTAISMCSTIPQLTSPSPMSTCGVYPNVNILPIGPSPSVVQSSTINGVANLLHLGAGPSGPTPLGQDILISANPLQIAAGLVNPARAQVGGAGNYLATSDSIVTAYIFDTPTGAVGYTGLSYDPTGLADTPQSVFIVGFARIFVSYADANGNVVGYILSVAGCGSNPNATCGPGAGNGQSINSPTMIPVRLISTP